MKFTTSTLAEVNLEDFEDDLNEDGNIHHWLINFCTFQHAEAYEFIHHLFLDESEEWFAENVLKTAPQVLRSVLLRARQNGAARVCFYL